MYDIIIVGGGPAGLTAAIYAVRANKKVLVLEATACGGQIIYASKIENYPAAPSISGLSFAQTLQKQAEDLGAEIEFESAQTIQDKEGAKLIKTENGEYEAKAVIIACGTKPRSLRLENLEKLIGRGISFCATCDGAFFKDKVVAVNGGGNSALHEAIYLSDIAKKVYLVHRRDEFRAGASLVEEARGKDNIEFVLDAYVSKLTGNERLESIEIRRKDSTETISLDGLFISIGREPNVRYLMGSLELTEDGYVMAGEDCTTNIPGVFVAGDVRDKAVRQLVTAASDGAIAAEAALKYINEHNNHEEGVKSV